MADEVWQTAEDKERSVAQAKALRKQAAEGGSEAIFVLLGEREELEPHIDLRREPLRRSLRYGRIAVRRRDLNFNRWPPRHNYVSTCPLSICPRAMPWLSGCVHRNWVSIVNPMGACRARSHRS